MCLLPATLRQLIMGFRITQLTYVAAKLGLADHLEQGPQTPHALAQAVGAEPQALYRLLRALASIGLFAETADGAFRLTPLAQPLQTNLAGSLRGLAILMARSGFGKPMATRSTAFRPAGRRSSTSTVSRFTDSTPGGSGLAQPREWSVRWS
jgi:hypothetical protein